MKTDTQIYRQGKRSLTPDVCRGIAIFLVIWGHIIQQGLFDAENVWENPAFKFIYSFHMPLFMLISGYYFYFTCKKNNIGKIIVSRCVTLLRVILIWNSVYYILTTLFEVCVKNTGELSLKGWWHALTEGYWFLWATLFCTLAVGTSVKLFSTKLRLLGFLLFIPLALISPCRWVIISIYPFFVFGFLYHEWCDKGKESRAAWLRIGSILVFAFAYLGYSFMPSIGNSEWLGFMKVCLNYLSGAVGLTAVFTQTGRVLLYYVMGITGSVSLLVLASAVLHRWKENKIGNVLALLGRHSLQIYVLQRIFIEFIFGECYRMWTRKCGFNIVAQNISLFSWLVAPLLSAVFCVILYAIVRFVFCGRAGFALFGR